MKASRKGNVGVVELLLDKGADINAKDKDGETALWLASNKGNVLTVRAIPGLGS